MVGAATGSIFFAFVLYRFRHFILFFVMSVPISLDVEQVTHLRRFAKLSFPPSQIQSPFRKAGPDTRDAIVRLSPRTEYARAQH
jgi:hypothetical protein